MITRVRFQADDIWHAPDDGKLYEVIDGVLYVDGAPSPKHQRGVMRFALRLGTEIEAKALGELFTSPIALKLDEENAVHPDLVFVATDRLGIITDRGLEGTPTLVIEVLSPSTADRDQRLKLRRYAAAGIPHYWLADPVMQTLTVYRLGADGYELVGRYGPGEVYHPELFPGLAMAIDDLWR